MDRRLYKNDQNKFVSGVCSGMAEYIGIDPSVMRVIWILLSIAVPLALVAYIVCAMILPEKSSLGF